MKNKLIYSIRNMNWEIIFYSTLIWGTLWPLSDYFIYSSNISFFETTNLIRIVLIGMVVGFILGIILSGIKQTRGKR